MRDKCGNAVGQCCKDGSYQYREIETELKEDPSWPPVSCKSIDLATVFQRLENLSHTSTTQQYEVWSSLWIIVLLIAVPFLSGKKNLLQFLYYGHLKNDVTKYYFSNEFLSK